jgi:hypothetical protein
MRKTLQTGVATISILAITGCANMPGSDEQQGAVIGGASGAAVGAAVTKNRALGAVIGGAVGAAGGYVIGKNMDKIKGEDSREAEEAARRSAENPATVQDVRNAATADVNNDGFVTLDEVVAMEQAGLTDEEMIQRLRATNQVFELTEEQKRYLTERGVSQTVVDQLARLNQPSSGESVIGNPRPTI